MKKTEQEFARAIFELSLECGEREAVREQMHLVEDVLKQNPEYQGLLDTPAVTREEKLRMIDEAFASLSSENVRSLLKILTERRECYLFADIVRAFDALYDQALGILRVEATTAVPMSEEQMRALTAKLSEKTKKRVVLTNTVSADVLGGVLLRYGEHQLDGTLKTRLDTLGASLQSMILE